jgi:hypothetical protein
MSTLVAPIRVRQCFEPPRDREVAEHRTNPKEAQVRANAPLTKRGRDSSLVERIATGRPLVHVAAEMGGLAQDRRQVVAEVLRRGGDRLADRSSRPTRSVLI